MTRCPVCDEPVTSLGKCADCRGLLARLATLHKRLGQRELLRRLDRRRQERIAVYTARAAANLPLFAQEPS